MQNSDLSAALLAFDSEALTTLLDEVIVNCDLTFGRLDGLRKVVLTDRRDKLTIIGYRPTLVEALGYVLEVWQNVQAVEDCARLFASWRSEDRQEQQETFEALKETEAV